MAPVAHSGTGRVAFSQVGAGFAVPERERYGFGMKLPEAETLLFDRSDDGVLSMTLNRPEKLNAANAMMWNELLATFQVVRHDPDVRVMIITGAEGAFCSGADLSGRSDAPRPHQLAAMRHIHDVAIGLHELPMPTIAKVNGVAAGAGCNLALGCDLVVASDKARFSEIFSKRGLSVDFGGTWLLPRLIGLHRAKELAFFADVIDATEAERIGLVNRVVSHAQLDAFVTDWATRLAAGPPIALAQTKAMLNKSINQSMDESLDTEGWAQTVNFGTKDTKEAMAAFIEKRDPEFCGR
jgi:enoyl-CoA hydratase/carnithine racemase